MLAEVLHAAVPSLPRRGPRPPTGGHISRPRRFPSGWSCCVLF